MLTVGIPFYNSERTLAWAIQSVRNQSFTEFECLLVDDGSTDGSLSIARQFAFLDKRFMVIRDGLNSGLVARLNQIAELASGDWIVRMDSDDIMHPDRLMKQSAYARKNPDIDMLACDSVIIDAVNNPVGLRRHGVLDITAAEIFLKYGGVIHPTVMYRRQWILANPYDDQYPRAEDRELFVRTLAAAKMGCVREPLLFYRAAGNVRAAAYLLTYASERKVLLLHGPRLLGYPRAWSLWTRSWMKTLALNAMTLCGCEQRLAKTGGSLSPSEREAWSSAIRRAITAPPDVSLDSWPS